MEFITEQRSVIETGHCQHVSNLAVVSASALAHRNKKANVFKAGKGIIVCFICSTVVRMTIHKQAMERKRPSLVLNIFILQSRCWEQKVLRNFFGLALGCVISFWGLSVNGTISSGEVITKTCFDLVLLQLWQCSWDFQSAKDKNEKTFSKNSVDICTDPYTGPRITINHNTTEVCVVIQLLILGSEEPTQSKKLCSHKSLGHWLSM